MSEKQEIILRIKNLREQHLKMSQKEFSLILGVTPGLIGQLETGRIGVSSKLLRSLSECFNVNAAWVLGGIEPMTLDRAGGSKGRIAVIEPPDSTRPNHGELRLLGKDYAWVRRMGLSFSAGSGLEVLSDEDEDGILLPMRWFERQGVNSDLCVIVTVRGDSMAPVIPDGALVMIDCFVKTVEKTGIFAFSLGGDVFIKRIIPAATAKDGKIPALTLVSDNPAFAPVALIGPQMNALRITGKVRAVLNLSIE